MRRKVIIEVEDNITNRNQIVDQIAFAALKVLRRHGASLVSINQVEVDVWKEAKYPVIPDTEE